ncbi:MAG: adenylate/guanylate cyclase domain-containing protein [Nitrospira sp.]|nr:MAG: adenylate/guanylate cyclase domain-containing protein [Nitrospira sp.]
MMDDRVSAWLESLGLDHYREAFQQNAITWDVLPELNDGDLASLGVVLGHRKKLLRAIAQLSQKADGDGLQPVPIATGPEATPFPSGQDQSERRQLTVMFCDLVGSTALARRLDPEDLQASIRRFLDTCGEAISRFNGYIAKYMGDGLLVYFGYPHAHEHDAERAVHAGLAVLELVKALPREHYPDQEFEIAARIGIATGLVIVGELIGQNTATERSVFGETPNLASRLQGLAAPNQLIVDSVTKRLVGGEFECADQGTVALKGFETPVRVWQVLSAKPSASRFESYRSDRLVNFIGREHETALVLGRWREAVEGEGQVVLLCGEAGIGKSRLVRHLRDQLTGDHYETIPSQCSPHHTNTVLYPVMTYLRQAAGLAGEDNIPTQRQKLDTLMANSGLNDRITVALFADLLSIEGTEQGQLLNVSPDKRKDMTLEALVQYLQRLADHSPVLLIVEDAHWLDPTTLDLMTRIIDRIRQMRVLVVITFRPDFRPVWVEYSHVTFLTLSRLPRRQSAELIATMTRGKTLPQEVQQAILAKTDGVPLYIEELTENLLETGLLAEGTDSFALKAPLKDMIIPDSLQALLMERVDRLGPIKEIVQIGAAIGREFTYELLRATVEITDSELNSALDRFVASGLILQESERSLSRYRFKHMLVQEAAYNTLPKKSRRLLHARIAKTLEEKFAERVQLEPELLAYHFEQAGLTRQAIMYWRFAARRDTDRSANVEALNHFNSALDLLKDLPQSPERNALELEILLARGAPMLSVKGYASDDMGENYQRAKDLLQETSGSVHQFLAIKGLWVFHLVRGQIARACSLAENLLSLATQEQISDLLIDAHHLSGSTYFFLGRFDEAKHHLLTAISLDDPNQHRSLALRYGQDPGITARILLARTLWILGEVEQTETLALEAIRMARAAEHPYTLVFTLAFLSRIYSAVRNATRTLELTDEAIAVSTQYSFALGLAWATTSQGWALAETGQEEGLGTLLHGLAATRDTGGTLDNTFTLALLAELYLRKKRIDEGLATIEEALTLAVTGGELFWQAELLRLKGELLLEQSEPSVSAAEQCFAEALRVAQDQHANMLELRAAVSMARLLRKLNRLDAAKLVLHSVCSRFQKQVANPDLIEARNILEQLHV